MNLVAVNNEDITENTTASAESASVVNKNQNLPESFAGAQEGASVLLSEQNKSWNQTDSSRQGNQGVIIANLKIVNDEKNVPNITISENENGRGDKLTDSKGPENLEMPSRSDGNEDEKTKIQTKDDVPENLHKQEDAEVAIKLTELNSDQDNNGLMNKEEQNNLKVPVSLSVKELDNGVDLRPKNREPMGETCQISETNKEELDKKIENAATFAKQGESQNRTLSIDFQVTWDKSNPTGKVPETFLPNCQKPDSDNLKPALPLASTPSNSKICQNLNDSEEVKDQTENSKTNTFVPSTQPVTITNSGDTHNYHTENNVKMFNRMSNSTLNVSKQCPDLNSPQALTTYSVLKKSSVSVLSQITTDRSTRSQSTPLGQSLISGENLSELNKTLPPAMQRKSDESTSFQMGTAVYLGNSGRASSQNKSVNEMKPTTSVHQYNTNLNKTSTNKPPSNVITTSSKSTPSNYKATNRIHPGIQNIPEHLNQSNAQPLRLSTVPKNKETLEAESRFSFPTAPAINSEFSHNQRTCYARYDASSMQYVFYPDNSNIRPHNMCNRTKTTAANIANNNALPTERQGIFSAQPTQKNVTHFGSPYLLMWPQRGDQTTGADKLTITQQYSTQGLLSTYQQAPKNAHPNPINGSNLYSIPSAPNDTNLYKNQFSNRGFNLIAGQPNPGERSNSAVSNDAINKHQEILQNVPGTYNTIGQPLPSHQNDMFMNRENNISFPVSQNSVQRAQLSGHQYYQPHVSQNGDELKVRLSNSSHANLPFFTQSQVNSSNFYNSYHQYQELKHYNQGIPVPNTQGCSRPNSIPPAKTQNMYSSNSHNGHAQRLASSINSTPNPVIPTFQGQIKTATTTTSTSTSSLSSTKEVQKNADSSNRKGPLPDTGQHSGVQRSQNNIPELGVAHQGHALTKYPTRPRISNSSKLGTRFPAPDAYQNRPIYSKDTPVIDTNKDQMSYSPNNSNGILTWSQYYPQSFNPNRPLNPSQRVTSNYDPVHEERNVTELNFQLQGNMHSHYYASQSYNNYTQQPPPLPSTSQETSSPQNMSNSIPTGSNFAATYNASATGQNFDRFRVDNHDGGDKAENCKYFQEIATSMAGDPATWKVDVQDKNVKFPVQCSETGGSKPASSEQFQNYNFANDLCPKVRERTADLGKSTQVLTPTTAASTSTTSSDLLTNALCHPNLGMTNEELFLFSDFDPLFTSSLLTNDLDYFPENNSAFDQCFEDAASLTMAMISSREAQAPQNLDPADPDLTNLTSQQQLTPLSNIPDDKSMASSLTNIPLPQIHYNQIPPARTYYSTGVGDGKNLVPFANQPNESLLGYFPGAGISTASSKIGLGVAKPIDGYPDDSILKRFSDLRTSKTASQLAKPITDPKSGKKWVNKRGPNLDDDANGTAIKKRNRQKKDYPLTGLLPEEESAKKLKKKTPISKGPPRPRGRPPKNKSLENTAFTPTQNLAPQISVNDANYTNQTGSLYIGTGTPGVKLPEQVVELPKQIPMSSPTETLESKQNVKNTFGKSSTEPEVRVDLENRKNPAESDKSANESCPVSGETSGNPSSITKSQRELSDREVIDAVTKCLESISRSEEKENSDQMKEFQFDARSENADSALDSSVLAGMDTQSGKDGVSQEDQALSREEMLMKAYMELKMKLEERMSRSLWRQSYLKRQKPKNGKAFQKLSKKECMTPYSGTTSWGPDDDLFTRYSNRSANNNSTKLVATADSTSTSIDSNCKQTEISNETKFEVMNVKVPEKLESVEEPKSVVNNQLITSTELPGHKDQTVTTGATLRLPSMMEVVRTRLADDLPSVDRSPARSLAPEAPKTRPECTIQTGNDPSENFESIEKSRNREGIDSNESEQVENTDNTAVGNRQSQKLPATPRYPVPQPYFSSPLLPLPPPPPLPPQITHIPSNREKVNPRKVGPTIVENARICFEAIGKYLTKADSDFDSFLISYANIVQGLLNCGAERYSRIKAILINRSETDSEELTPENKKTSGHTAVHFDSQSSEDPFEFHPDIDASDIQGDSGSGENTIDVDDFSSNYAEIVKIILSSRADEYRNIKQALSRNICGGTDVCQGPAKSTGKSKSDRDVGNELCLPTPITDCEEANGPPLPKAERKHGKKTQCENSKDPAQVLKKRRKRKTHEEKESARLKNKVVYNNEAYAIETDCKQTTNRKLDILKSPSKWKHRSSGNSKNSSGFRIILSSNYFVEQSRDVPNLPVKSRKSEMSIEEDQEEAEARRPLSSDDGFVEESTGDYVIGLGSESGDDEKSSSVFRVDPLNEVDKQTDGTSKNPHITQSKPLDKPATCWESGSEIERNDYSSDFNLNEETICEAVMSGGDPETTVKSLNEIDTISSVSTEKQEENKRQRPSRKAASAGIGATRCSCGCCDDGSNLKEKTVENQLRDLTLSFKNRNRSKIIKPKRACIPKKRGRPRKIDKCPQKIISKFWTDTGVTEEESRDTAKILDDCDEPSNLKMSEEFDERSSVANVSFKQSSARTNTVSDLSGRQDFYVHENSDSDESSDFELIMGGLGDSDDSWKPKKSNKKIKRGTLKKKKGRYLATCDLFQSDAKAPLIGVCDSRPDGTYQQKAEECLARKSESSSEEDECCTKKNSLTRNAVSKSTTVTGWADDSSPKEFNRDGKVSKTRISFKDFVPNLKIPPLPKTPLHNTEASKELNINSEIPNSDSTQTIKEVSKFFTGDNSNNKSEPLESSKPFNQEEKRIELSKKDGGLCYSSNNDICGNQTEVRAKHQCNQSDTSLQTKAEDNRDQSDISKEGYFERVQAENGTEASQTPKEANSSEERLRSLIEKITEINAATKRLDTMCSVSVESGSENIDKDSNGEISQSLDGGFGSTDCKAMKVKTELLEGINETIRCPIGANDSDDSSNSSHSSNSSQSSEDENQRRRPMGESQGFSGILEVKMPSPLNSKKKKPSRTFKIEQVGFENKIIIRKSSLAKEKKRHRARKEPARKEKNIFDIMSQDEDEERGIVGREMKREPKRNLDDLSCPQSKKSQDPSFTSGVNKSYKSQRSKADGKSTMSRGIKKDVTTNLVEILDSHAGKHSILSQAEKSESSPGFSTSVKKLTESGVEVPKIKKRKRVKTNQSLLTEAKIHVHSEDERFSDSVSYSKKFHTDLMQEPKTTVDDNLLIKAGETGDSKPKTKKRKKKSETDLDVFNSKDDKIYFPFDVQKVKKRKKPLDPENDLALSANRKVGNKEKLIISGALRRNRQTIDGSSSDQDFATPLKTEGSLRAGDECSSKQKLSKRPAVDRPPLQCSYCSKSFKKPSELLYHTRRHTGVRPFLCDQCDKTFVSNSHLLRHKRTHSSERRHVCPTCNRGFTQHYGMLVHQLIHSGLKPHKCPDCSKEFRTKGSLGTHRRKHQPKQVAKEKEAQLPKDPQDYN